MSDERTSDQPDARQGSVFGNLPDSRPGPRSPRRGAGATGRGSSASGAKRKPKPKSASGAKAAARPKPRSRPAPKAKPSSTPPTEPAREPRSKPAPEAAEPERQGAGLEDLAWAGVATVAEAATIGIRLASRAMEALRKPSDGR
jgi:hypothetical protein